jgi:hypothetical protein
MAAPGTRDDDGRGRSEFAAHRPSRATSLSRLRAPAWRSLYAKEIAMAHVLDPKTLQTEAAYLAALDELDSLLATDPDTPAGHRFDELVALIEAWEARQHPRPAAARWPLR